ncbi:MAG: CDP-glucose 4,6-dehydratase [Gammaproteobacteria bacterium]|nr:CDP-glucose 4,6-dehydratase [Gammaproteobacteria bacterium]
MFDLYKGKTVLITGHTGFKGAWLCEWLLMKQANVIGFSLDPPSTPALFEQLDLKQRIHGHYIEDIRNFDALKKVIERHKPDYVFHMAAQTLVRESYRDPITNFETNIMGTVYLLEAIKQVHCDCICVVITTDKVYENNEWLFSYRENDQFGGYDPYSSSKACAEILTASYNRSYFFDKNQKDFSSPVVATVRAGNVIGGGDWADERIVPDCIKYLADKQPIPVRNRTATRPWQHVLEPLGGYLTLALKLAQLKSNEDQDITEYCSGFNFGPNISSNKTVEDLVNEILLHLPGEWTDQSDPLAPHEAGKLNLASEKAFHLLGWRPRWTFAASVEKTAIWYKRCYLMGAAEISKQAIADHTRADILHYEQSELLA